MSILDILLIMLLLQLKHLVVDWCWQPEYEWRNKGTYGHPGGLLHATKNAVGTALCFLPFTSLTVVVIVLIADWLMHYHIDFAKTNINRIKSWGPLTHAQFWWLTGLDQALHQVCYVAWLAVAVYLA